VPRGAGRRTAAARCSPGALIPKAAARGRQAGGAGEAPQRSRDTGSRAAPRRAAMIAKDFPFAKTIRAHSTNFLRQSKSLRDHGIAAARRVR